MGGRVRVDPVLPRVGIAFEQAVVDEFATQQGEVRMEFPEEAVEPFLVVDLVWVQGSEDLDEDEHEGASFRRDGDDPAIWHERFQCLRPEPCDLRVDEGFAAGNSVGICTLVRGEQRGAGRGEVLTGFGHPRANELLEIFVLGHGVTSSSDQVSPSTKPGQEITVPVSSEDSLPFAMRSVCWEHDLGWALDAPATSIDAVVGVLSGCRLSAFERFEVHPPSGSADEGGVLLEDMIAEVVPESRTEVHGAGGIVDSSARGGHDFEAEPRGGVIDADIVGPGLGMPGAEEVVFVAADEGGVARAHQRLGGGGPGFTVEGGAAAVVVGGAGRHSGAGADHLSMISAVDSRRRRAKMES